MNKQEEEIDISIRIGNSFDWHLVTPGRTYNFRVYRNTEIKELKSIFCECFESPIREDLEKYQLYTKKMIRLYSNNIISDAFENRDDSDLEITDKGENIFYALII